MSKFTTASFLKAVGFDALMNGGDVSETLGALKKEMVEGMAKEAMKKPETKKSAKQEEAPEPEVIDTEGEEVKDASDFAKKYGRK